MNTKLIIIICLVMIQDLNATDLTSVFPKEKASFFQNLFNNSAISDGPNCFNFALFFTDIIDKVRFVDGTEFQYRLDSNNCKIIDDSEEIRYGDLRVIYQRTNIQSEDFFPYHVQVYLNKDMIAEKSGMSKDNPYRITSVPVAGKLNVPNLGGYRSSNCSRSSSIPEECFSWVNIYRCNTSQAKSNIAGQKFDLNLSQIHKMVTKLEVEVEAITLNVSENKSDDYTNARNDLKLILSYLGINIDDVVTINQNMINSLLIRHEKHYAFTDKGAMLSKIYDLIYRIRGIDFQLMQIRYPQNSSKPASGLVL